jgi:hypothetical protein
MFAAKLYGRHDLSEQREESLAIGKSLAEELEDSEWLMSQVYRAYFYGDCLHDPEQEQRAWEKALELGLRESHHFDAYLMYLLRIGQHKEFDYEPSSSAELEEVLAWTLLRAEEAGSRSEAIQRIVEFSQPDGKVDPYTAAVLSLLGCDGVRSYAKRGFKPIPQVTVPKESQEPLERYFLGESDEDQLIAECRSRNITDLTFVRLCVGMKRIGAKDGEGAEDALNGVMVNSTDPWSAGVAAALLARLEEDANWPYVESDSTDTNNAHR